ARPGPAACGDDPPAVRQEASAEVRAVEVDPPDALVDGAQLAEREGRPDERGRDAAELEVDADALDGVSDDPRVVERELDVAVEDVRRGNQIGVRGVGAGDAAADFGGGGGR